MEITEVKVKLMEEKKDRLQAFCTITMDNEFVIRDLKIIEGAKGYFVAMPSRKLTDKCPKCSGKNQLRSKFCSDCGARLNENRAPKDERGRAKLHADIAHPINQACRERMQAKIVEAFKAEMERAKEPGYVPTALYEDEEVFVDEEVQDNTATEIPIEPRTPAPPRKPDNPAPVERREEEENKVESREPEEDDGFGKGIFS